MNVKKKGLLAGVLCFMFLFAFPLYAETEDESGVWEDADYSSMPEEDSESAAETPAAPARKEVKTESATTVGFAFTTLPEFKLVFSQSFKVPVLRFNDGFFGGNNIKFGMKAEVAPVFMTFYTDTVFTPLPLIELDTGAMVGTGWNIGEGPSITGIGINERDAEGKTSIKDQSNANFSGTFLAAHFGAAFQFNLAAVVRGSDWNHILFRTYHKMTANAFTGADKNDTWFIFNDYGENRNGWKYNANYLLGYQMPAMPVLNMLAFLFEMEKYLTPIESDKDWGDTLARWDFGFLINLKFNENITLGILPQFRLFRNYANFEYPVRIFKDFNGVNDDRYFQDRGKPEGWSFQFYRVAFAFNWRVK